MQPLEPGFLRRAGGVPCPRIGHLWGIEGGRGVCTAGSKRTTAADNSSSCRPRQRRRRKGEWENWLKDCADDCSIWMKRAAARSRHQRRTGVGAMGNKTGYGDMGMWGAAWGTDAQEKTAKQLVQLVQSGSVVLSGSVAPDEPARLASHAKFKRARMVWLPQRACSSRSTSITANRWDTAFLAADARIRLVAASSYRTTPLQVSLNSADNRLLPVKKRRVGDPDSDAASEPEFSASPYHCGRSKTDSNDSSSRPLHHKH
ncbi:hypothetical protein B0H67DRAFT_251169 [Lasiosphaeris hirsuta]|uniref:Uncharacterized protein n=1 Tax=Lasiosphaeris hirsuta TaxID=260670 RepID=A0AA40AHC6_9PEZI|nr:hypothetical protein B0H67DRAFT_251169 [Lasiosphaeris hirsuta]